MTTDFSRIREMVRRHITIVFERVMRITIDSLRMVNPDCLCYPVGYNEEEIRRFRDEVNDFARHLTNKFSASFLVSGESHIQDSTHGAEIYFPDSVILDYGDVVPCIRISNHRKLFVITVVRRISNETETLIESIAECLGFTYTPENFFGKPFDLRQRVNGDLFNQLYDYV